MELQNTSYKPQAKNKQTNEDRIVRIKTEQQVHQKITNAVVRAANTRKIK